MLRNWKFEIQLTHDSGKAIYLQIADAIIKSIQSGRLKSGDSIPGSRNIAQLLKVNRNTVVEALNVLLMEGWLVSKERQGTFVPHILPAFAAPQPVGASGQVFKNGEENHYRISFDDGHPDTKVAPIAELARAYRQIFNRKARWQMMGYTSEFGDMAFRKELTQMLNHERAMQIQDQQICITRGSQMATYLTAMCLLEKGDYVMVETPGYTPAWKAIEQANARLLPVRVDNEGLVTEDIAAHLRSRKKIKALYCTPHRQYPTTVTLSLKRRLELVSLSNKYGFTIIEDDYDNEFHFGYRPILPLSSLGSLTNYVYIGTMSKVIAPALRTGYLASSDIMLINKIGELRRIIDVQGDAIMEQAILQLIKDGTIKRHIKKATGYYREKRDKAVLILNKHLKDKATFHIPDGGLAFWIEPARKIDWHNTAAALKIKGISIIVPEYYSSKNSINGTGIRIGYAALSEEQLEEGIKTLAKYL